MHKYYLNEALGNHDFDTNSLTSAWRQDEKGWYTLDYKEFEWFVDLARAYDIVDKYKLDVNHIDDYENLIEYTKQYQDQSKDAGN